MAACGARKPAKKGKRDVVYTKEHVSLLASEVASLTQEKKKLEEENQRLALEVAESKETKRESPEPTEPSTSGAAVKPISIEPMLQIDAATSDALQYILDDPRYKALPLKKAMCEMTCALAMELFGEEVLKVRKDQ